MEEFNWAYASLQQEVESQAALKIQSTFRGKQARQEVQSMKMTKAGQPVPKGVAAAKSKAKESAPNSGTAKLTQEQMQALREKYDMDGDQMLMLSEFKDLARQVAQLQGHPAPSFSVLEDIFDEFDSDFTGKMSSEEFNWAYATLQLKVKEEQAKEASRILKITLERVPGKKLGFSVEDKTLEVKEVKPEGLVAEWNYTNPTKTLQVGHVIKKVPKGKKGSWYTTCHVSIIIIARVCLKRLLFSKRIVEYFQRAVFFLCFLSQINDKVGQAIHKELMNRDVSVLKVEAIGGSQLQKPPRFFTVRLDRSAGGKLGMQVEQPSLEIQNLAPGGLACKWNKEHPKERIRPGDSIMKVNDKEGMAGFKEVMMNPSVLVSWSCANTL